MLYGALEAGGTKMVCATGDEKGIIRDRCSIPAGTPEETIPAIIDYFKDKEIAALGVASFGPVDLDENSPTYGYITTTPKVSKVWHPAPPSKNAGEWLLPNFRTAGRYGNWKPII